LKKKPLSPDVSKRMATLIREEKKQASELVMVHLGMLQKHADRLLKVLLRKDSVVDRTRFHEALSGPLPKGPLSRAELEYLDEEFKDLVRDATAARVRLHEVLLLLRLTEKPKKTKRP
jgi:urocanate hydratase